jgi:hypothetical protein
MWFLRELDQQTTFVMGGGKNAGKTTFLNLAAKFLRRKGSVGLVSIGVDGEGRDLVFGTPKPLIPVEQGDVIVTTDAALGASGGLFRVLDVFPVKTALGKLVLAQVLRGDFVELVGPETNSQLSHCLERLQSSGVRSILVDGAVNRMTQVSASLNAGVVDVMRVNPSTKLSAEERLRFLSFVSEIPALPSEYVGKSLPSGWWDVDGALTPGKWNALKTLPETVVVPHFASLFLDSRQLAKLPCKIFVRKRFELRAVVLNAWDVDEVAFVQRCASLSIHSRVWINPYKESVA